LLKLDILEANKCFSQDREFFFVRSPQHKRGDINPMKNKTQRKELLEQTIKKRRKKKSGGGGKKNLLKIGSKKKVKPRIKGN